MKRLYTLTSTMRICATLVAVFMVTGLYGATYYSKSTATDFNSTASWGTNADGSGAAPGSISNADDFIISNSAALTLTGNASVRTLTITSGSLTVSSNTLTVAIASQNNSTLLVNGGTLNLSGTGAITLNGNFSMTSGAFNQTGGSITLDGNNGTAGTNGTAGNSVASGTHHFAITGGTPNCSAGTITIVDPPFNTYSAGTTRSISINLGASTNYFSGTHTFILGDGVSTAQGNTNGFTIETYAGSRAPLNNVTVNGGSGTNRFGSASYSGSSFGTHLMGTLTINSGSQFNHTTASSEFALGGLVNNGTLIQSSSGGLTLGGLSYTNNAAVSVSGSGTFSNNATLASSLANFTNLTINTTGGVTFSGAGSLICTTGVTNISTVSGTLTMTTGNINLGGNVIGLGSTISSAGTLSWTAGWMYNGAFRRWLNSSTLTTTLGTGVTGFYPLATSSSQNRSVWVARSGTWTSGGWVQIQANEVAGQSTVSITDGAYTINRQSNSNWTVSTGGGLNIAATTMSLRIQGDGIIVPTAAAIANLRLSQAATVVGTYSAGTGTQLAPQANRTAIASANFAGTYYLGINNSDQLSVIQSAQTGPWGTGSTWVGGVAPTNADWAIINPTHNVTVNAVAAVCSQFTVSSGGTLTVSGNTLTTGNGTNTNNLANTVNGTMSVSAGTVNVNGSLLIANGSTFSQTGGDINIDGNSGTAGTSVATGTDLFSIGTTTTTYSTGTLTFSGGTLTIVDPHFVNGQLAFRFQKSSAGNVNAVGHTFRFGDGTSSTGGSTSGFQFNVLPSSARFSFGNLVVNGPNTSNRLATPVVAFAVLNDLTINSGGELAASASVYIKGNLVNNGTLTQTASTPGLVFADFTSGSEAVNTTASSVSGTGTFRNLASSPTANYTNLKINNTGGVTFSSAQSVSGTGNGTVSGTLNLTAGFVNLNGNTFTLGTAGATPGTMSLTAGAGFNGGTLKRFVNTSTIAVPSAGNFTATGVFPFLSPTNQNRYFHYAHTAAASTAGFVQVTYNDVAGTTNITTYTDAGASISKRSNSNWVVSTGGGLAYGSSIGAMRVRGDGYAITTVADARISGISGAAAGTSTAGTNTLAAPEGNKGSMAVADFTGTFYFAMPSVINSVATGNWDNTATWDCACVPTSTDNVVINNGHNVSTSGTDAATSLVINTGGTLTVGSNTLDVSGTLINSGTITISGGTFNYGPVGGGNKTFTVGTGSTLNVSAGTFTINGNFAMTGGTFTQTGGNINIDANSGTAGTSYTTAGGNLFSMTAGTISASAGTITIVDPPHSSVASGSTNGVRSVNIGLATGSTYFSGTHTFIIGDGVSTTGGNTTDGFVIETYSNGASPIQNLIINGGSTAGRHATPGFNNSTSYGLLLKGNLTINANSEIRTVYASGLFQVAGNITNNGTLTISTTNATSALTLGNHSVGSYTAAGLQTISGSGVFRNATTSPTANYSYLTINNTNGVNFSGASSVSGTGTGTVANTFTLTAGKIGLGSGANTFTLGTGTAATGTLSYTAGGFTDGTFARWFGTGTISIGVNSNMFPFLSAANNVRNAWYGTSGATTTGGTVAVTYTDGVGTNLVPAFTDNGVSVEKVSNANWQVSQTGLNLGAATAQLRFRGDAIMTLTSVTTVRATLATAAAPGTSPAGGGTLVAPEANKTGLTVADLANTFYIGAPNTIQSVASGVWSSTSVWDCACVPTSTDNVVINNTHTVQTDGANVASNLTISSGGVLTVNTNSLTLGNSLTNSGTINVGGGVLRLGPVGGGNKPYIQTASSATLNITSGLFNVNGYVNMTAGAFNQSGGGWSVDGNDNTSAGSVPAGTRIFTIDGAVTGTVSAGQIEIVDPHFDAATTQTFAFTGSTSRTWGVNHWLTTGNAGSTDASSSPKGFEIDCYVGSGRLTIGTLEPRGTGTNKWTTTASATGNGTFVTDLFISTGFELRTGAASTFTVSGNINNSGTLTVAHTLSLAAANAASTTTQTISGSGVFQNAVTGSTANFANLTINNTNATGITFLNNASVSGTLNFTAGRVALGSNTFTLGVSTAAAGTLSYTAGGFTSGTFTRWFGTSSVSVTSTTAGRFPFVGTADDRSAYFGTSGATSGGTVSVQYFDAAGSSTIPLLSDAGADVSKRSNANWSISNSFTFGASTGNLRLNGAGIFPSVASYVDTRITDAFALAPGTSVAGTGSNAAPQGNKTTMSSADLAGSFYLAIPTVINSVATGNWSNTATWDCACVPTSADQVIINNTHNVTLDGANAAATLTIATGGTLTAASNSLTLPGNLTNNGTITLSGGTVNVGPTGGGNKTYAQAGTLTISSGTLNVNGNVAISSSSTFNQSGGNFNVDGNSGVSGTSVASGTALFALSSGTGTVTGGTITIVDPPFAGGAESFRYSSGTNINWAGHTLVFGDGVSTNPSTATYGFMGDTYYGFGTLVLGNVVVNGGSGTSRFASATWDDADGFDVTNLTINSGSEFRTISLGSQLSVAKDVTNNGTLTIDDGTYLLLMDILLGPNPNAQTVSGSGVYRNDPTTPVTGVSNLYIENNNATGVTFSTNFTVTDEFDLYEGRVNLGSNTFTLGTSNTNAGILGFTTGDGGFTGGTFTRWFNNTSTVALGNVAGQFPFIESGSSFNRMALVGFTGATSGGTISVTYNDAAGTTPVTTFLDNGVTISKISNANWVVSNTMTLGAQTASLRFTGDNVAAAVPVIGDIRATYATGPANGNSANGSGTATAPEGNKNLLAAGDIAGTFYIGYPSFIYSVQTGNWSDVNTWDCTCVPSAGDIATVRNGHVVTLDIAGSVSSLSIEAGGQLDANANSLTIGNTLTNNGTINMGGATVTQGPAGGGNKVYSQFTGATLNVSAGTYTINGSMNIQGGTFNQTGGVIEIDGNSGTLASSVAQGTHIFQAIGGTINASAGTLRIIDPPHSLITAGTTKAIHISLTANATAFSGTHTVEFGNGTSTTSGNADGFAVETYSSGRVPLQNVTVNAGSASNRFLSGSYTSGSFGMHIKGNLTINAGSEVRRANIANEFVVGGDITNNGTMTSIGAITLGQATGWAITNAQVIGGSGTFRNLAASPTAMFTSLTFNNTSTTNTIDFSGVANPTASGTLTFTAGLVSIGAGNTFTLGLSAAAPGTMAWTDGGFTNGTFSRWYATATVGAGSDAGRFPFTAGTSNRSLILSFPSVAPTTGGTASVLFTETAGTTLLSTFNDGPLNIDNRYNSSWAISTSGIVTPGANAQIRLRGAGLNVPDFNTTTISLASGIAPGTRLTSNGTNTNPQPNRGSMTIANLSNTFYLAYDGGTCPAPTALTANTVGSTTATIGWTSTASAWDIEYGITGYTPDFVPEVANTGLNPNTITGLTPQTGYDIYVRARCGATTSSWVGPLTIATIPGNDNICGTLPVLTVNDLATYTTYSNIGATTSSSPALSGTCQDNAGLDVWFQATVPAQGGLAFNFRPSATNALTDLAVYVYTSSNNTCSGTLTLAGCDDDNAVNTALLPFLFVPGLTPGSTVFVRVADYQANTTGNFDLAVTPYYQWTGATSTTWTTNTNWLNTDNAPAALTDNIIIPSGLTNYPVSVGNGINHLTVQSGGKLSISGTNSVTVRGNIIANNAQFLAVSGTAGRISMVGSSPQTITGNGNTFNNLRIDGSGGVTIASGANMQNITTALELKGGSLATNGNLTIKSTATTTGYIDNFSSTFGGGFAPGSTITMERFSAGATGFRYLSMPINNPNISEISEVILYGTNMGQLIALPTCSPNNIAQNSPYGNVMEWHEDGPFNPPGCRQGGWYVRSTGTLQNVRGYLTKITAGQTLSVTGQPNMTDQTFATSLNNTNSTGDGWHLMGNPFPSPIQWTGVTGFGDMNLFSTSGIYTGTYAAFAPAQNKIIASQQGFFVRRLSAGALPFTLTNAMRRASASITYQTNEQYYDHLLEIDVTGNGFGDHSTLYFNSGATAGYEAYYDARKMDGREDQPMIYTHLPNGGEQLGVNGLGKLDETYIVPLVMKPGQTGTYTLNFGEVATFPQSAMIYLEDLQTGTLTDLRANPSYTFASDVNDNPERFNIRFEPPVQANVVDQSCESNGSIELVQAGNTVWSNYVVKDHNEVVYAQGSNYSGTVTINNLPAQEYIVTLNHPTGYSTQEFVTVNGGATAVNVTMVASATNVQPNDAVTFTATSTTANSYNWSFGDGEVANGAGAVVSHTYAEPGVYTVSVTAVGDDCQDTDVKSVSVGTTGINTVNANDIKVFGYGNRVVVEFNNWGGDEANIRMFNMLGQQLQSFTGVSTLKGRQTFDVAGIKPGYYLIQIVSGDKTATRKLFLDGSSK